MFVFCFLVVVLSARDLFLYPLNPISYIVANAQKVFHAFQRNAYRGTVAVQLVAYLLSAGFYVACCQPGISPAGIGKRPAFSLYLVRRPNEHQIQCKPARGSIHLAGWCCPFREPRGRTTEQGARAHYKVGLVAVQSGHQA